MMHSLGEEFSPLVPIHEANNVENCPTKNEANGSFGGEWQSKSCSEPKL